MTEFPDYSILVPAFNEERFLPETLDSLREAMASVPWRGEIVVCDNNSTDSTAAIAGAHGARVVFEPVNQISRARNAAAAGSRGRWLVMVDADTRIEPQLLRSALERLATGRVCGGGAFVRMDIGMTPGMRALVAFWHFLSRRFHLAAGAFVFCTREAFDAVGGFSLQVYAGEEIGFSRAAGRWGRRRGLAFEIIESPPVLTSGRKTEWFSPLALYGTFVLFAIFPFLIRSKAFCWYWYRRPVART